jgi:hypothetical protein
MRITTGKVALDAREVIYGTEISLQHVHIEAPAVTATLPFGSGPCGASVAITLVIAETEINRQLLAQGDIGIRDPHVALMTGSMRVTGRFEIMGRIAGPFTMVAVPQVESGTHVRLDVRDISVIGATLPGFSAQIISERINAKLAELLNVRKLGLPVRLVSVAVETGRMTITAEAQVDWQPGNSSVIRTEP